MGSVGMECGLPFPVANSTIPFWRTELSDIDSYKSSPNVPGTSDILIIGSGLSGSSTAYHILNNDASHKPSVTLLEARQVCSGATGRNGGHCKLPWPSMLGLASKYGTEVASEIAQFHLAQITALKTVVETERIRCDFQLRRSFDVYLDEDKYKALLQDHETFHGSIPAFEYVDFVAPEYVERVTGVKSAKGAFSVPACSFWPYELVCGLLKIALDKGLQLFTHTTVTSISPSRGSDGYYTVNTSQGSMKAKEILFASNGYTGGLLPEYRNVIVSWKGQCSRTSFHEPDGPLPHLSDTYNITRPSGSRDYINSRPDGSVIVGGGNERYKDDGKVYFDNWDDSTLIQKSEGYFEQYVQNNFTVYKDAHTADLMKWTGIMGYTPDSLPHLGPIPGKPPGQYIMAGFNGGGMSYIFVWGKAMAEMILEEKGFEGCGLPKLFETTQERTAKKFEV